MILLNRGARVTLFYTRASYRETKIGGHAMLVVGYYESEKLFLVRNSWGTSWASSNKYGYSGHALMPYDYIKKYCDGASTLLSLDNKILTIPSRNRLSNNSLILRKTYSQKAAAKANTKNRNKYKKKKSMFFRNIIWIALGSAITLFIIYYDEVIEYYQYFKNLIENL